MPKHKNLSRCKDYYRLLQAFSADMVEYFEKQIEAYMKGSDERPAVVCWWEGIIDTEDFIELYL